MLMPVTAWDSLADLERIGEQINRLFDPASSNPASDFPALNVWTNQEQTVMTADLPGVTSTEMEIAVEGDIVTLRGARTPDPIRDGETLLRQERAFGRFERSFRLPYPVDTERVEARLQHGVLKLVLPRAEADKPRKIAVQAA